MGELNSKQFCICKSASALKRKNYSKGSLSPPSSLTFMDKAFIHSKTQKKNQKKLKYSFEKDFHLIKEIGRGSYGNIYLVTLNQTKQNYAVKQIYKKINFIQENEKEKNIYNEKKILKYLSHPFIIKLHFSFQDEDNLYLVMDYISGGDLSSYIHNSQNFNEEIAKFYLSEVYLAIRYLHSKNIIHRDIKSENILLDSNGHIKLIDFGTSKKGVDNTNLTSSFIGTPECLPPEVLQHKPYGFSYDWWCFGILMYEMIYGFPPFRDFYQGGIFHLILNSEPLYYKFHPSYLPRKVKISSNAIDLIQKLLCKNPEKRIKPEEIPKHPFFKGIDFDRIKKQEIEVPHLKNLREYFASIKDMTKEVTNNNLIL